MPYHTDRVTTLHRERVHTLLAGLDSVPEKSAERIVEAWSIMSSSSCFELLENVPVSPGLDYGFVAHTNDVVLTGRVLAAAYQARGDFVFDPFALDEALFLHDIDKLLMFRPKGDGAERGDLARQMPHGVVAGILLSEMGFSETVISIVATHATDAPFHVETPEGLVMHYADMAAIDRVRLSANLKPFYASRR